MKTIDFLDGMDAVSLEAVTVYLETRQAGGSMKDAFDAASAALVAHGRDPMDWESYSKT